ncbi:MAG: hypothetical protein LKJ17_08175 [Oscillospiraceae bacterium]|jgi:hypothetical protein|nr:hypothetical protein [Oscillospiraceae bacterium]
MSQTEINVYTFFLIWFPLGSLVLTYLFYLIDGIYNGKSRIFSHLGTLFAVLLVLDLAIWVLGIIVGRMNS